MTIRFGLPGTSSTAPPTSQKISPGLLSDKRGAEHRDSQKSQARTTNKRIKKQEVGELTVYAGQVWLGMVRQIGPADFVAVAGDGHELGTFATLKAAADAIEAHGDTRA
jgi:hypothetical protein